MLKKFLFTFALLAALSIPSAAVAENVEPTTAIAVEEEAALDLDDAENGTLTPTPAAIVDGNAELPVATADAVETPIPTAEPPMASVPPNFSSFPTISEADPGYKAQSSYNAVKITYSDGSTAVYDKGYKALFVNGSLVKCDVKTVNDRTLVPIRFLVEALNGSVSWDEATKKVTLDKDGLQIEMTIGSTNVFVNGNEVLTDVPPNIYDDYTYLPIRFVSETFGASVAYTTNTYNPAIGKFIDYSILQGLQGNVVVDQYDPLLSTIPSAEAASKISYLLNNMFMQFKDAYREQLVNSYGEAYVDNAYSLIQDSIIGASVIGEVSRYYVVEGSSIFLVDKFTGTVYTAGADSSSTWVSRFYEDDPNNSVLFLRGYFYR
ncbi:MAG: copper amine oxidase N-terminal domain-containing protein [Clostridiales bacterium]|jgi:hypothetical protein|nr:copper amine oxidase N-terminal domain-containing protein [Clostridiales bacterium]